MRILSVLVFAAALALPIPAVSGVFVSGPLPSEFQGGFLLDRDSFKVESKLHSEARRLAAGLVKCFSKGVKNHARGKPSGVHSCVHHSKRGVLTKYNARTQPYFVFGDTVSCTGGDDPATALGQEILQLVRGWNFPYLYCASASGAFLDPVDF